MKKPDHRTCASWLIDEASVSAHESTQATAVDAVPCVMSRSNRSQVTVLMNRSAA